MALLLDLLLAVLRLPGALLDALLGVRRKRYETAIFIRAPQGIVWDVVSARKIKFAGPVPVEIDVDPRPGDERILEGVVRIGTRELPLTYREISEKPGEAALIEILKDGTHHKMLPGDDYYVGFALSPAPGGTQALLHHEVTHRGFLSRLSVPIGARQSARRIQTHCEALAGRPRDTLAAGVWSAFTTGAITYASFAYLFGWLSAAVLLVLILIHEMGHVVAMRWVGLPVKGIYFVPFMGGVAVAGAAHKTEGERGFVALMGPGLSLITTAIFVIAWLQTNDPLMAELALLSAILNGINLVPVLPLDGGHVLDSILSSAHRDVAALTNLVALLAGLVGSVYMQWHVLTVLLLLTAPSILFGGHVRRPAAPVSRAELGWLAIGYLATIAFYAAVVAGML